MTYHESDPRVGVDPDGGRNSDFYQGVATRVNSLLPLTIMFTLLPFGPVESTAFVVLSTKLRCNNIGKSSQLCAQ